MVDAKNQTIESTGYEYEYDREGNRVKRTDTSDDSYEVYTWDHRNRLVKVEFFNSSNTLTKSIDYVYDAFNRMVKRTMYRKFKRHFSAGPSGAQPAKRPLAYPGSGEVAVVFTPGHHGMSQ